MDFFHTEQFRPPFRSFQPHRFLARRIELSKEDRPIHLANLKTIIEQRPDTADEIPDPRRTPPMGRDLTSNLRKIVRPQACHSSPLAQYREKQGTCRLIVAPRSRRQLARVYSLFLAIQKNIRQILHGQCIRVRAWCPSGVEIVLLLQVSLQSTIRVGPSTKAIEFTPDFLGPIPGWMRIEWEFGIGLGWLFSGSRPGSRGLGRIVLNRAGSRMNL